MSVSTIVYGPDLGKDRNFPLLSMRAEIQSNYQAFVISISLTFTDSARGLLNQ